MTTNQRIPKAVNFHVNRVCNERCAYCFATFRDDPAFDPVHRGLPPEHARAIVARIAEAGVEKLNFAGGEPTLYAPLPGLLRTARGQGLVTSVVSNGARLEWLLGEAADAIDWVGLSVDSAIEQIQRELGRGDGDYCRRALEHFARLHAARIRVKLNTVVTALNHLEDMSGFVLAARPERWKVFQFLPVARQNDANAGKLAVTPEQFRAYLARNARVAEAGITMVPEENAEMTGAYAMIDPAGRFFSNVGGRHSYSDPILEIGVEAAFAQVVFHESTFERRGGRYDWGPPDSRRLVQLRMPK